MANGFQVIKFVMADFDPNWKQALLPNEVMQYTAAQTGANLAVAFEGATGVFATYRFQAKANDVVYVVEDKIHVSARCQKQEAGNTIKCGG